MNAEEFVASNLPPPPSRVLEVGCGAGELALAMEQRGYSVTAIDPEAPAGRIFRRTSLEEFSEPGHFDAVVANRSLHHIHDLAGALAKASTLLRSGGVLILNEFAWERMDEDTVGWYLEKLEGAPPKHDSLLPGNFPDAWNAEHEGLHYATTMRRMLDESFHLQTFEWTPYISEYYLKRPELVDEEQRLIDSGAIRAIGFRYVGIPRSQ
jgi:SAM-dependent methyltransferase